MKQTLLVQLSGIFTFLFTPSHIWVLNQMKEFGMKTGPARPSPFPSLSRVDLPTKSMGSQQLSSNSQLGHKHPILMVEAFDCSKFYLTLSFNIRKLVYLHLWTTLANQSNVNNKAAIFVFHFLFFNWFGIQVWNNEVVYQTLEISNIFHNLFMLALWHTLKCITHHHYHVCNIESVNLKESWVYRRICTKKMFTMMLKKNETNFLNLLWPQGEARSPPPMKITMVGFKELTGGRKDKTQSSEWAALLESSHPSGNLFLQILFPQILTCYLSSVNFIFMHVSWIHLFHVLLKISL